LKPHNRFSAGKRDLVGLAAMLASLDLLSAKAPNASPGHVCQVQPPVERASKARCTAEPYFQAISCLYGTQDIEAKEAGDRWLVTLRDSKPIGAHACRSETVRVCRATGALVWSTEQACDGSAKPGKDGNSKKEPDMQSCQASIGSARLGSDGELLLQLRAASGDGAIGDALIAVPGADPRYAEYLRHIGGLHQGEVKAVPPWGCKTETSGSKTAQPGAEAIQPVK